MEDPMPTALTTLGCSCQSLLVLLSPICSSLRSPTSRLSWAQTRALFCLIYTHFTASRPMVLNTINWLMTLRCLSPSETLPPWTLDPLFSVGGRDWGWRMECSLRDRSSPTRAHSSESWITGNSLQTLSPTTYSTSPLGCLTLTSNLLCPRVSSFSQSNGNCTLPVAQVRGHNFGIVLDLSLSNLYLLHQQLWLTLTFKIYPEFNLSQPLLLPGGSGRLRFAQITVKASQWSPQLPPCLCDSQLPRFRPVLHCSHSGAGSCLRRDALTLAWETPEEPATPPTVLLSSLATVAPLLVLEQTKPSPCQAFMLAVPSLGGTLQTPAWLTTSPFRSQVPPSEWAAPITATLLLPTHIQANH